MDRSITAASNKTTASGSSETAAKLSAAAASATSDYSSSLTISSIETTVSPGSTVVAAATTDRFLAINALTQPATKLEQIDSILLSDAQMAAASGNVDASLDALGGSGGGGPAASATSNVASLGMLMLAKPFSTSSNFINHANRAIAQTTLEGERKILSLHRSISEKLRNSLKNANNVASVASAAGSTTTAAANVVGSSKQPAGDASVASGAKGHQQQYTIEPRKWHSERYRQNNVVGNLSPTTSAAAGAGFSAKYSINAPLNAQCKAILAQYENKAKQEQQMKQQAAAAAAAGLSEKANVSYLSKTNRKFSRITIKKRLPRAETPSRKPAAELTKTSLATAVAAKQDAEKKLLLDGSKLSGRGRGLFMHEHDDDDDYHHHEDDESDSDSDSFHSYGCGLDMIQLSQSDSDDSASEAKGHSRTAGIFQRKRHHTTPVDDTDDEGDEESEAELLNEERLRANLLKQQQHHNHHHASRLRSPENGGGVGSGGGGGAGVAGETGLHLNDIIRLEGDENLASMTLRLSEITQRIFNENASNYFYERSFAFKDECQICFEQRFLNERQCCGFKACNLCINTYIETQIKQCYGIVRIECLNSKCNKLIHRDEITERMAHFDHATLKRYLQFLVDANKDSSCKTCPRCSHVMKLESFVKSHQATPTPPQPPPSLQTPLPTSAGSASGGGERATVSLKERLLNRLRGTASFPNPTKVQCIECQLIWCFNCHAPWHDGIGCNEFKKGDKMLKYWAKELHYGQQNAQLCPKCKIYIQRTKGCDHMVCTLCLTEFCYKCGGKFHRVKFIGDHYSRLSVLGCKYKFYPEKPLKRKVIRGSILSGKVVAAPLVASLALVAGLGILVFGCVALPIYGSYRLAKHVKNIKIKKTIRKNLKSALSAESIEVHPKTAELHYSIESNTNLSHISVPCNNESSGFLDTNSSSNQAATLGSQKAVALAAAAAASSSSCIVSSQGLQLQNSKRSKSLFFGSGSSSSGDSGRGSSRTRSMSKSAIVDVTFVASKKGGDGDCNQDQQVPSSSSPEPAGTCQD